MELILVRHPEVAAPAGTCYGQTDLPARTPCAALPWAILSAALKGQTETVSVQV